MNDSESGASTAPNDYSDEYDESETYPDHLIDSDHPDYDRHAAVAQVRRDLWDNGHQPVPIYNHDLYWLHEKRRGKQPVGTGWQIAARANPPACITSTPAADALNTGILCDGLRAVDIDIKGAGQNPSHARFIRSWCGILGNLPCVSATGHHHASAFTVPLKASLRRCFCRASMT